MKLQPELRFGAGPKIKPPLRNRILNPLCQRRAIIEQNSVQLRLGRFLLEMFKKPLVEVLCDRTRIMAHPFAVQVSVPFKEETTINEYERGAYSKGRYQELI
jgi:hypothetical protein